MIASIASAIAFAGVYGETKSSRLLGPKRELGREYELGICFKQDRFVHIQVQLALCHRESQTSPDHEHTPGSFVVNVCFSYVWRRE
jgi:hypothetical protein